MKKLIATLLLVSITFVTNSQNLRGGSSLSDGFKMNRKDTQGHQFLLNDWVEGFLVDNNGKMSSKKLLNLDIYNNNPTYKASNSQKDIFVIDNSLFSGFVLIDKNKKQYIFTKIEGNKFKRGKKETKYYQLLNAPKKSFILESIKKMKDPNASGWTSSLNNTKVAKFVKKEAYYILNSKGKYEKIKLKESHILKALKDKKKQVKAYIKSNNINIKSPADVITVLDYYASLK
ncbi:MAG: hypothetical protein HWD85_12185 [Flavobacteriaceae bacterium]|nr:hypothetical protein [Flavobacteriaceae bacterium]